MFATSLGTIAGSIHIITVNESYSCMLPLFQLVGISIWKMPWTGNALLFLCSGYMRLGSEQSRQPVF